MTDAAPAKTDGTSGTSGTTLICKENPGPVGALADGTSGTGAATTGFEAQAVVPVVPFADRRAGPEKPSDFNAVPLAPLVPLEKGKPAPDLLAAFEAIFAAAKARDAAARPAQAARACAGSSLAPAAAPDAFEERAAIREHDGGETREDAERAAAAEQGITGTAERIEGAAQAADAGPDPARLAAALMERGPMTQGAAARVLGWGATQVWQAEAQLSARALIDHDRIGRAALSAAWEAFERANDPFDPEAWR